MPRIVYTNYRQSLVITGGRLLRWKNCELIDTMPDNSVSASDIRRSKIVALTCWHVLRGDAFINLYTNFYSGIMTGLQPLRNFQRIALPAYHPAFSVP